MLLNRRWLEAKRSQELSRKTDQPAGWRRTGGGRETGRLGGAGFEPCSALEQTGDLRSLLPASLSLGFLISNVGRQAAPRRALGDPHLLSSQPCHTVTPAE